MWNTRRVFFPVHVLCGLVAISVVGAEGAVTMGDIPETYGPPRGYVCYRNTGPITVDGKLDEPSWLNVPWTDDFVDIEGTHKVKPRYRTRAKMLWDDTYFYVGAELEEPHVWGTLTKRDSVIFEDNDFEVFIDPDSDNHEYYEFEMNALNTVWDLFLARPYMDGGEADNSWDIDGLKTGVHVDGTINDSSDTDKGWSVEIAFPWKALAEYAHKPTPPRNGDQWRVDFSRVEWQFELENGKYKKVRGTKEDNWVWSPQGIINMHRPETWGYVQFSTAPVGQGVFVRDPTEGARLLLCKIYSAQKKFRRRNRRWAKSLTELEIALDPSVQFNAPPRIELASDTYTATAEVKLPDRTLKRVHIRADSKIWVE